MKLFIKIIGFLIVIAIILFGYHKFYLRKNKSTDDNAKLPSIEEIIRPVKVSRVTSSSITRIISTTGIFKSSQKIIITPKVPGELEKLFVDETDEVEQGDTLAVIDREVILTQLNQAKASVEVAEAGLKEININLNRIKTDYQRIENLFNEGVETKFKLDQIKTQYESLLAKRELVQSQIKQAQANLQLAQIRLKDAVVISPIPGIIVKKYLDPGNQVAPGVPILAVEQINPLKILINISSVEITKLSHKNKVSIILDAFPDKVFKGKISKISPLVNTATQTIEIELIISNENYLLKPGMFARIDIELEKHDNVVVIPRDVLIRIEKNHYVYTVKDGFAYKQKVITGIEQSGNIEIIKGISPGQIIVIGGQANLKDGSKIKIVN